jgi:hypothetical protein
LGEVLCASYVDYKYGQRTKAFKAQTDWQWVFKWLLYNIIPNL